MSAKLAVLASGEGSNFEAIVQAVAKGRLGAQIVGLLCNRPKAAVLQRAARMGVPAELLRRNDFSSPTEWDRAIRNRLRAWRADWVVLAGFTGLIGPAVLAEFPDRVVNSHPSLLPKYGGKGMYGEHVHAAVLQAGEVESGVTIHLLNERFDEGPIVAQKRVPILPQDTPAGLAERIKAVEREFYPQVLEDLLTGRIKRR